MTAYLRDEILRDMHDDAPGSDLHRLWTLRLSGQVRRMHTLPVIKNQSVGEHTFNAMHIATQLCWRNMMNPAAAVLRLLFHDVQEVWTGDVPAHIKNMPGMRDLVGVAEEDFDAALRIPAQPEAKHLHQQNIPDTGATKMEQDIAKASDIIELMMSCVEERRRGNKEQRIGVMYWRCKQAMHPFCYISGVDEILSGINSEWNELQ